MHSKTITLSDEQKKYIKEKLQKLLHYSSRANDESTRISVDVDHEKTKDQNHIHCIVNLFLPGANLHAENYAQSVEAAIDNCEDKLTRQMHKYKLRMQH